MPEMPANVYGIGQVPIKAKEFIWAKRTEEKTRFCRYYNADFKWNLCRYAF